MVSEIESYVFQKPFYKENLMVRIVSDSSTLYSTSQALDAGFSVSPLSVTRAGKTYR